MKKPNFSLNELSPEEAIAKLKKDRRNNVFSSEIGDSNVHIHVLANTCICFNCINVITQILGFDKSIIIDELFKIDKIRNYVHFILPEDTSEFIILTLSVPRYNLKNVTYLGTLEYLTKMTESLEKQGVFE